MSSLVVPRALEGSDGLRDLCDRCALMVVVPVPRTEHRLVCEPCALEVRPSQLPAAPRAPGWWWVDEALAHEAYGDGSVLVASGHELHRYAATPAGLLRLD